MYCKLQHYSVKISVFSVKLCDTAIPQSYAALDSYRGTKLLKGKTRLISNLIIIAFQYTD
jgi:hypothetical protein